MHSEQVQAFIHKLTGNNRSFVSFLWSCVFLCRVVQVRSRKTSSDATSAAALIFVSRGDLVRLHFRARTEEAKMVSFSAAARPEERTVLDHIYISVSDVPRSLSFYAATLEPLGWIELGSYDSSAGPAEVPDLFGLADGAYGSGVAVGSSIWLRQRQSGETGLYVGFVADDEAEVIAAYAAAIEAGGTSEGEPAIPRTSARATTQPTSPTSMATTLR